MRAAEEMLLANRPLGPKRDQVVEAPGAAIGKAPDPFYTSVPFEWPEHVPTGRVAVPSAAVRHDGELADLPRA